MAESPNEPATIRFNVLGELEVIRERGMMDDLPRNVRAGHLLALLAFKTAYDRQELIDVFWPGETLHHPDPAEVARVQNKLDQVLTAARRTLEIDSSVLASDGGVVRWVEDGPCRLTTDLGEFQELARSNQADDWRAALALVRGEFAVNLKRNRKIASDPFKAARALQKAKIRELLERLRRLEPDASDDTLDNEVEYVLGGHYRDDYLDAQPSQPVYAGRRKAQRHRWRRWRVAGSLSATLVALGLAAWAVWPSASPNNAVPPTGAVVDAQTGRVVHFVASRRPQTPGAFSTLFWICNVSDPQPCYYPNQSPVRPITAHRGDTLEVSIRLDTEELDGKPPSPVPLLGVSVLWYPNLANASLNEQEGTQFFSLSAAEFDRPDGHQIEDAAIG